MWREGRYSTASELLEAAFVLLSARYKVLRLTPSTSPTRATVMSRCSYSLLAVRSLSGGEGDWSSSGAAAGPGYRYARVGTFVYEVAFEFGEGYEDIEHESNIRGRGVDVLLQRFEIDTSLLQRAHVIDEVSYGLAEPVESPNHQNVTGANLV